MEPTLGLLECKFEISGASTVSPYASNWWTIYMYKPTSETPITWERRTTSGALFTTNDRHLLTIEDLVARILTRQLKFQNVSLFLPDGTYLTYEQSAPLLKLFFNIKRFELI